MKVLFICPYPVTQAPSQRFRYEQYLNLLQKNNIFFVQAPFLDMDTWNALYKKGNFFKIFIGVIKGVFKRFSLLLSINKYDYIFIHREALPYGPPIFEFLITKVIRLKVIYDFDDAIWLEDPEEAGTIKSKLKWKSKVAQICKWSWKISTGNAYLSDFAKRYSSSVVVNPTTIDTEYLHNPGLYASLVEPHVKMTIGWTGTHSTLIYLNSLIPVLENLEKKYDFTFLIIANQPPHFKLKSLKFLKWSKRTEIEDLLKIDIGIMPLTDDEWSRGKCGFKALQYMSLGIPALVSPIGVNQVIVDHEINGFHCKRLTDWYKHLSELLINNELRKKLGENGRNKVVENYSVLSNSGNFLSLFDL